MRPFMGEGGMYINERIVEFQREYDACRRGNMHLTNTILCRPDAKFTPAQWKKAIKACTPRLVNELANIPKGGLLLLLGGRAMQAIVGKSQAEAWHGYPLDPIKPFKFLAERGVICFPMLSPSFILAKPPETYTFQVDFLRALKWHAGDIKPWVWPEIQIGDGPHLLPLLEKLCREKDVGFDVETAGANPWMDDLLCLGVAGSAGACSITWPPKTPGVEELARSILADRSIGKIGHNVNYDKLSLKANGISYETDDEFDTMIADRVVFPQLRHGLSAVASREVGGPRWKTMFRVMSDKKGAERFRVAAQDPTLLAELELYNGKDAYMTWLIKRPLLEKLRRSK
jgi:uracil-DNA glycosylase family 4